MTLDRRDGPLFAQAARPPVLRLHEDDEIIVDNFAGGGGASLGIEWALGRSPDIAVNHDPEAVALHAVNHPNTRHMCGDVWEYDPVKLVGGRPVGLAWFSPDCTFHSKARGGRPFRQKDGAPKRRALAWVVIRWARTVKPRVILLENVEELEAWGPLDNDGHPIKAKKGFTFKRWMRDLRAAGYQVETRQLRACDYGAPTTRKRLFIIARCDGQPIVWPEPTHGPGRPQPYRVAAECIQWELPCPSIFERTKPLAEKTMRRIARGVQRFVIEAAEPFIVPVKSWGGGGNEPRGLDKPMRTVTASKRGEFAIVDAKLAPFAVPATHDGDARIYDLKEPFRTITGAKRGEIELISPILAPATHGDSNGRPDTRMHSVEDPMRTLTTLGAQANLIVPTLIQTGYGERPGQAPRVPGLGKPLGTVMAQGQKHALVAAALVRTDMHKSNAGCAYSVEEPTRTVTTAGGHGVVAAFLAKHNGGHEATGSRMGEPVHTITTQDHHAVVASHMLHLRGSGPRGGREMATPAPTITAEGTHLGEVRAFLTKFYGTSTGQPAQLPLDTITTKDRFGVVYVHGEPYAIADIGMRMLAPRELFRAQGFADSYIIDPIVDGKTLSKTAQIRMCGNSVCPPMAAALVSANVTLQRRTVAA